MAGMPETTQIDSGRNLRRICDGVSSAVTMRENNCKDSEQLMDAVVERENMTAAHKRVVRNKGSAGADGMSVNELKIYLNIERDRIRLELLEDRYIPKACVG